MASLKINKRACDTLIHLPFSTSLPDFTVRRLQTQIAPLRGSTVMQHLWPSDMPCVWPSLCCHCPHTPLSLSVSLSLCVTWHTSDCYWEMEVFCVCVWSEGVLLIQPHVTLNWVQAQCCSFDSLKPQSPRSRFDLFCIRTVWRHLIFPLRHSRSLFLMSTGFTGDLH